MAGRFRQANVSWDDRVEYLPFKELLEVRCDLACKRRAFVEHRQKNSFDHQIRVPEFANPVNGVQQCRDAFESKVLTLNRNEHGIRGDKRIEG